MTADDYARARRALMRRDPVLGGLIKRVGPCKMASAQRSDAFAFLFTLLRSDVLPVGDLGVSKAIQRAYRLRKPPTPDRIRRIAEPWRPYRSVGCWYLWRSLDEKLPTGC